MRKCAEIAYQVTSHAHPLLRDVLFAIFRLFIASQTHNFCVSGTGSVWCYGMEQVWLVRLMYGQCAYALVLTVAFV